MIEKNQIPVVLIYDRNEEYETKERDIKEYLDTTRTFKYVLFRICDRNGSYSRFLRLSPLNKEDDTGELWGDTHLTIIGKAIKELTTKRDLTINDIDLSQDSGHGLLWIIHEEYRDDRDDDVLKICAEVGGFMKIKKDESVSFFGESEALNGGNTYYTETDDKVVKLIIRIFDKYKYCKKYHEENELPKYFSDSTIVNPIHGVPALLVKKLIGQKRIDLPVLNGDIVEFNPETIEQTFSNSSEW